MKPIRVLQFICPTGFYGAERWVLAFMRNADAAVMENELAITDEAGSNFQLFDETKKLGLHTHQVPMQGRFDLAAIRRLVALIKERKIDIIHTHGYKSDLIGIAAAKRAGIKAVCTPHGFENTSDLKLRGFIWAGCQSFRFFDAVVPLSKALLNDVLRHGVSMHKAHYIQNGVDLSEIDELAKADTPRPPELKGKKVVGFIGQLISRKNVDSLLRVFDRLAQENVDLMLHLYGDGESRESLERYAQTLNSSAKIKFHGFVEDRLERLKHFDLFAMSSTLEGIPRCLMEAMAMQIPVAAYDIAGIDQLITDKVNGRLAPLHDEDALFDAFKSQLFEADKAKTMAKAARQKIDEEFSAKRMTNEYGVLFETLLKRETPAVDTAA